MDVRRKLNNQSSVIHNLQKHKHLLWLLIHTYFYSVLVRGAHAVIWRHGESCYAGRHVFCEQTCSLWQTSEKWMPTLKEVCIYSPALPLQSHVACPGLGFPHSDTSELNQYSRGGRVGWAWVGLGRMEEDGAEINTSMVNRLFGSIMREFPWSQKGHASTVRLPSPLLFWPFFPDTCCFMSHSIFKKVFLTCVFK